MDPVALQMKAREDSMIRAHKAGRDYATRLDATRQGANIIAQGLTVAEGDAFLGGYYGELRRLRGAQ